VARFATWLVTRPNTVLPRENIAYSITVARYRSFNLIVVPLPLPIDYKSPKTR
jgi:hypothetical protein